MVELAIEWKSYNFNFVTEFFLILSMSNKEFNSAFKSWKIYLAIVFALFFASYSLIKSMNEVHFVETSNAKGTHSWIDFNKNKKIDFQDKKEFYLSTNGDFRIKTNAELISEIPWTKKTFFWIFLALLFVIGRDLAYMWRIKILTKDKLSWKSSFFVIMLWEFASAVSPGVVGGSAVAMFILNKEKIPLGKSTAIVIITAMMDNLFYVIMIPIVFLFIAPSELFPSQLTYSSSIEFVFWLGFFVIFSICFLLFVSIFFFPKLITFLLKSIFSLPYVSKFKNKAIQTGKEVEITSKEFQQEKMSFWFKSFFATLLSWISRYLVINCVISAFISLKYVDQIYIFGKQLVLWLFMLISPTPGASGVAEYAFGELMLDFSSSVLLLSTMAIIWRLISYFPYLLIGVVILPQWIKKTS